MSDVTEKLRTRLKQIIKRSEDVLGSEEKESFYHMSLDDDGMPYSFGNADDVYSDGFDNGCSEGSYSLARELLAMMNDK